MPLTHRAAFATVVGADVAGAIVIESYTCHIVSHQFIVTELWAASVIATHLTIFVRRFADFPWRHAKYATK